jgi:hypothetical protein
MKLVATAAPSAGLFRTLAEAAALPWQLQSLEVLHNDSQNSDYVA